MLSLDMGESVLDAKKSSFFCQYFVKFILYIIRARMNREDETENDYKKEEEQE